MRGLFLRPRLLPDETWARIALALLVVFALARGLLWASTQPGWLAPDEDYHWLYTEYVLIEKTWPDLDEPFATQELFHTARAIRQGTYYAGPRTDYRVDPHASFDGMVGSRKATGEPPRQVLHPPGYHLGAAAVDRIVTNEPAVVRLTAIRYFSAFLGALLVFLAWLLAAQVLSRTWQQLAVPAIVATQPQLAFSSATVSNDVLVASGFAAVLACCAWLLRTQPSRRQGWTLGAVVGLALLAKTTALVAAMLAGVTLLFVWRTHRHRAREVAGMAWRAGAVTLALAGWWYVIMLLETGSLIGNKGAVSWSEPNSGWIATGQVWFLNFESAWDWLRHAYWYYWVFQFPYEVGPTDGWELVPLLAALVGIAGLALLVWRCRRTLFDPARPTLRQTIVLAGAPIGVTLPFFLLDMWRATHAMPFITATGRFSLAGYSAVATLFVLGLTELGRKRSWLSGILIGGGVVLSLAYYIHTYAVWGLERYYGPLGDAVYHATWDKPTWVTETFLWTLAAIASVSFIAASIVVMTSTARRRAASLRPTPQEQQTGEGLRVCDQA